MAPLANLVATSQVKLGDFVRIDMAPKGRLTFTKEVEGAMLPVLLEKYGPESAVAAAARVARRPSPAGNRRHAVTCSPPTPSP